VKRPRDLTRQQLKEVKLLLDGKGYTEAALQSAVRQQSNQDIAASIIGHIRRAALGEALLPFEQRVAQAMDRIYTGHNWQPNQRRWLERSSTATSSIPASPSKAVPSAWTACSISA